MTMLMAVKQHVGNVLIFPIIISYDRNRASFVQVLTAFYFRNTSNTNLGLMLNENFLQRKMFKQ